MKTILFLFIASLSAAIAGEVQSGFDPLFKGNVRVDAQFTKLGSTNGGTSKNVKTIEVKISPIGAPSGPVRVDCMFMVQWPDRADPSHFEPTVRPQTSVELITGAGRCEFSQTFSQSTPILGWAVRVVKDDRVIGVEGSSPKFLAMAADPATKMRYKNYLKKLVSDPPGVARAGE